LVRFNFKLSLLLILILSNIFFAQRYPDKVVDSLLSNGINNLVVENYPTAKHFFSQLDNKYPELPLGKIYLAALKITEAYDYAEEFDEDYITENLKKAESLSKSLLNKANQNIWNHYFLGLSAGNYAYFQALRKNWISAFSNGLDAVNIFNKCKSIDSTFYDAYTAIGTPILVIPIPINFYVTILHSETVNSFNQSTGNSVNAYFYINSLIKIMLKCKGSITGKRIRII